MTAVMSPSPAHLFPHPAASAAAPAVKKEEQTRLEPFFIDGGIKAYSQSGGATFKALRISFMSILTLKQDQITQIIKEKRFVVLKGTGKVVETLWIDPMWVKKIAEENASEIVEKTEKGDSLLTDAIDIKEYDLNTIGAFIQRFGFKA